MEAYRDRRAYSRVCAVVQTRARKRGRMHLFFIHRGVSPTATVRKALAGRNRQRGCGTLELGCSNHRVAHTREGIDMNTTEILLNTDLL